MKRWILLSVAGFLGFGFGCGWDKPPEDPSSSSSGISDDPPFPRKKEDPPPLSTADCNVMRLVIGRDGDGAIQRLYVRIEKDGRPALLTFDTGNPITKLSHDSAQRNSDIKNAAQVRLFCDDVWLDSQPQSSLNADGSFRGMPVVGALGSNVLEGIVLEVDARRQAFIRHPAEWTPPPDSSSSWNKLPLWFPKGVIVTKAKLDATEYWMTFDTGGWRTFLFDSSGDTAPPRHVTHDWVGNEVIMTERPSWLVLGDAAPRKITLDRSGHYPVFEYWMQVTGASGAIGISSIGTERFILDKQRSELLLAR